MNEQETHDDAVLDGECGFTWPLNDPGDEDRLMGNTHHCVLMVDHALRHRCTCGDVTAGEKI